MKRIFITGIALLATSAPLAAQDQMAPRSPNVFLEKAYFSLATPTGKNLAFEGQPTVHYFFANGTGNNNWQADGGVTWAFPVSAMLQVRMTNDYSMPVKTPSYRIRPLYAQRFSLKRPDAMSFRLSELGLGFTHYSNGQRGCTYQGFTLVSDTLCEVSNAPLAAERRTNTEDGDFSTSYFSLDWHYRSGKRGDRRNAIIASSSTFGIEVQIHPLEISPGGMNGDQAKDWGQHQVTLSFERENRTGLWFLGTGVFRVAAEGIYRKPATPGRKSDAAQIEVSVMPDNWKHQMGFYARLHVGSDYYNIQYQDRKPFVALGLMWDLNRLDKINTATPP